MRKILKYQSPPFGIYNTGPKQKWMESLLGKDYASKFKTEPYSYTYSKQLAKTAGVPMAAPTVELPTSPYLFKKGKGKFTSMDLSKPLNSTIDNPIIPSMRDPNLEDSDIDWLGLGNLGLQATSTGIKGGLSAVKAAKTAKTATSVVETGTKLAKGANLATFGKGAVSALGGAGGIANLAVTAGQFLPGMKESDYQDTTGNIIKYGGMGLGALALAIPGLNVAAAGVGALALANNKFGKTAKEQGTDTQMLTNYGVSGYTSLMQDEKGAGKKTSWTGNTFGPSYMKTKNINKRIDYLNGQRMSAAQSGYENQQNWNSAQNNYSRVVDKNQAILNNNNSYQYQTILGKKGAKINPAKLRGITKKIQRKSKPEELVISEIQHLSEGGKVMNVIPEGALHARKHNLPEEIADQVTNKGIPVITFEEDGGVIQHAEIEVNEIIFSKDTTVKLEAYYKQYNDTESEDKKTEIAIEAGKFLASEILENTDDRTGLLNEIK